MIGEKMYNVIQSISPERRVHFVLTLSINLEHKDGHKVPVNIYLTPFLFDDNDNMWMLLGRISFSPKHYKNQHILYIDLLDSNERYLLNESRDDFEMTPRPMLTHMEKSVLILCTRGYLQKEVAESLKISINTVKTHKRNLLRKLEADNVSEAYIMSTIHKLL
jgi:DNA-binding CsgD family transcriptional regulator